MVRAATAAGLLQGRIPKVYRYFPPSKGADSAAHPKLHVIQTSIQKSGAGNYFGRVITEVVQSIPAHYIKESREKGFPTVLIIGNKQYLTQVSAHLKEQAFIVDEKRDAEGEQEQITREDGLQILKEDPESSLGWRIMFEMDRPKCYTKAAARMLFTKPLVPVIPKGYRDRVSAEVKKFKEPAEKPKQPQPEFRKPTIKLTSFQSAKGLSAQYVFVVGLHEGDLPRNPNKIDDIEVCKFLVALTRTRKQCYLLWTRRFAGVIKNPSMFLNWIDRSRNRLPATRLFGNQPSPLRPRFLSAFGHVATLQCDTIFYKMGSVSAHESLCGRTRVDTEINNGLRNSLSIPSAAVSRMTLRPRGD